MPVEYNKPFLTVPQQIELLRSHGMRIDDEESAELILRAVGYYRFSGYSYPFRRFIGDGEGEPDDVWQTRLSEFESATNFVSVHQIYEFDRRIRMRVFDGIEKFEIAFRFIVGHFLAQYGPFAHRDPANLDYEFTKTKTMKFIQLDGTSTKYLSSEHATWLRKLDGQESRSQESFSLHHLNKYAAPLPLWKATEVMSFGTLVRLYDGLKQQHRQNIAAELDILDKHDSGDSSTLSNWLNHIRYIRNTCAHHSRLWNRNLDVILAETPAISELSHLALHQRTHLYGTLTMLGFLLARTHPEDNWRHSTASFVTDEAALVNQNLSSMGFPDGWESEDIWRTSYKRDEVRARRVRLIAGFETYTSSEASAQLHAVEPKLRKSKLTYLRKNHGLLGLKLSSAVQFPTFQFDPSDGRIFPLVIETNRRLFVSMFNQPENDVVWASAEWWATVHEKLGELTPVQALREGKFSLTNINEVIPGSAEDPEDPVSQTDS